jgi:hypothetical protein
MTRQVTPEETERDWLVRIIENEVGPLPSIPWHKVSIEDLERLSQACSALMDYRLSYD